MFKKIMFVAMVVAVGVDAALKEVERESMKGAVLNLESRIKLLEDGIKEKTN